jgi:hypothetical protein
MIFFIIICLIQAVLWVGIFVLGYKWYKVRKETIGLHAKYLEQFKAFIKSLEK